MTEPLDIVYPKEGIVTADYPLMLLDTAHGTLIALDLLDARAGGMGLACVVDGVLGVPVPKEVLHGA